MHTVKYVDINDYSIKKAKFFSTDPTLNSTTLVIEDGTHLIVAKWQLDLNNGKR